MRVLLVLMALIVAALIPAASAAQVAAEVEGTLAVGTYDIFAGWQVPQGQYVKVYAKVTVSPNSPVALDGFYIKVRLQKPDGSEVSSWHDMSNVKVNPGQTWTGWLNTGIKADPAGHWYVKLELYDKNKNLLDDTSWFGFDVVEQKPTAYVSLENIAGYTMVAGLIAGALYVISRIR